VRIRLAAAEDAAAVAKIYAPAVRGSAISFELDPPDTAEMAGRIRITMERTPWLVCVDGDEVTGYAYASRHRDRPAYQWSVEVSAYVRRGRRRNGAGRALYSALFEVLRLQGFRSAYAGITLPNPASVGLHAALGFTHAGLFHNIGYKDGAWHDVAWMELTLLPHVAEPPVPVPLPALLGSPALAAALNATARGAGAGATNP
jgi:L-amino acid N-acyltransferase YncA